jgi:hypothetical protein
MKIIIISCLLILSLCIKVKQVSKDDTKLFSIITTPSTIRELLSAIKSSKVEGGAGVKECYDLILKSKYETALKQFWRDMASICVKENEIIPRVIFNNLLNSQEESIKIEGKERKCKDVLTNNMLSGSEVENPVKQRELRKIMEPFFSPPVKISGTNQKNIITAYLSNREYGKSAELIEKLNRN